MMCWEDWWPAKPFANVGHRYFIIVSTENPMLTIRKARMDVFSAYMVSQNLPKMVEDFGMLRRPYFLKFGAEGSRNFVHAAVERGLSWGIRKFADVWALIDLMLEFRLDFASEPARPWAQQILNRATLSGTAKIKLITAHLRGQLD
jgi:hypothetical protein